MSAFDAIFTTNRCRRFSDDVSVHWWAPDSDPDDPCLCGERSHRADRDEEIQ